MGDAGGRSAEGRFPETHVSVVEALRGADRGVRDAALATLVAAYWKPVYVYLRLKWRLPPASCEDLTQGFFTHAIEKGTLAHYDASKARLRTWLRSCLDAYVVNERKAERRLKRGGRTDHVPLDFADAEREVGAIEPGAADDPDELFHREWVRGLLAGAVEDLRAGSGGGGRAVDFAIFERYDLADAAPDERPTYAAIAAELDVPVTKVTNALHAMRRRFRDAVLARLRASCASEREFRSEARALFGTDAP